MAQRITGTAFVIGDDPRQAAVPFLGDPLTGSAESYISLFDPDRGADPINVSIPWVTQLKNLPGATSNSTMDFTNLNVNSITFDNLELMETMWEIDVHQDNNYSLSFPAMTEFDGVISDDNNQIVSVNCPEVVVVNSPSQNINFASPFLTTLNFPKLVTFSGDINAFRAILTKLNFPALRNMSNAVMNMSQCAQLTDITSLFGITSMTNNSLIVINNALTTSAVNAFLVAMATNLSSASAGSTIDLSGQSPPAPPTGAGAAAKAILQGYGLTVTTD